MVGVFIPLAGIPMAIVLLVAIFPVHLPHGFSSIKLRAVTAAAAHFGQLGYETGLLYLAGGSGPLALDRLWRKRRVAGQGRWVEANPA